MDWSGFWWVVAGAAIVFIKCLVEDKIREWNRWRSEYVKREKCPGKLVSIFRTEHFVEKWVLANGRIRFVRTYKK